MSKYIDAERLNMEWQTLKPFGVTDTMIENLKWIVDRQPTIEVSEDCIDRKRFIEALDETAKIWAEQGNDILVRGLMTAWTIANNAPSVTPEQSSMVGEWKNE